MNIFLCVDNVFVFFQIKSLKRLKNKKNILFFLFSFIKMSDKLLLTILGAVGIGALMMGMTDNDVHEDFIMGKFQRTNVKVDKNGVEVDRVDRDDQENVNLTYKKQIRDVKREKRMEEAAKAQNTEQFEYFQSSLGSGQVANDNIFHSNPQFNQTIPQPSPDMQYLGVPSRLRESSMQGHTDSFNSPVQYGSMIDSVENFEVQDKNQEVVTFDRSIVSTRGGGRFNAKGSCDFIRGDVPVCPDPCQSGWFRSSARPEDVLQRGILDMLGNKESTKDLDTLLKNRGKNQFTPSKMETALSRGDVSTVQ